MTGMVLTRPGFFRLELPGGWVVIRTRGRWEVYDHYPDDPGLERFRGYADGETADALERVFGIYDREAGQAALEARIAARAGSLAEVKRRAEVREDWRTLRAISTGRVKVEDPDRASLVLASGERVEVVRQDVEDDWIVYTPCPTCGATPIRCRAYPDEVQENEKRSWAPAWCSGRHDAPIGTLEIERVGPRDHHTLRFMGVPGQEETFRCRIY